MKKLIDTEKYFQSILEDYYNQINDDKEQI